MKSLLLYSTTECHNNISTKGPRNLKTILAKRFDFRFQDCNLLIYQEIKIPHLADSCMESRSVDTRRTWQSGKRRRPCLASWSRTRRGFVGRTSCAPTGSEKKGRRSALNPKKDRQFIWRKIDNGYEERYALNLKKERQWTWKKIGHESVERSSIRIRAYIQPITPASYYDQPIWL